MRRTRYLVTGFLIVLSAIIMIQGSAPSLLPHLSKAHAASISITLSGCVVPTGTCTAAGWFQGTTHNPTITVTQGDTITLHLSSADHVVHQFIFDIDGSGICSTTDPCSSMFSTTATLTFTVGMASGTYDYGCSIHPQMAVPAGFIVNPATPPFDYTVSAGTGTVSTHTGVLGNSTITIAPQGGFTGTVSLATTTNSTNLSCSLSTMSITGGSGNSILSCKGTSPAEYLATVTGTSGSLSHSTGVVYNVTTTMTVDGSVVPVDKAVLLSPYIGLGLASAILLTAIQIYSRRRTLRARARN